MARADVTKLRMDSLRVVVGIGVAPDGDSDDSVDLVVREFPEPWPEAARNAAARVVEELGLSRDTARSQRRSYETEFPERPASSSPPTASRPRSEKATGKAKRQAQRAARKRGRR